MRIGHIVCGSIRNDSNFFVPQKRLSVYIYAWKNSRPGGFISEPNCKANNMSQSQWLHMTIMAIVRLWLFFIDSGQKIISCYLTVGCSAVVIELEHSAEIPAYGLDITSLHVHPQHGDRLIVTTAEGVYRLTNSECTVSFIHT